MRSRPDLSIPVSIRDLKMCSSIQLYSPTFSCKGNSFSSVRKERKESLRIHSDIARASFVFITLRIPLPKRRYPPRRDVERKKRATDFFFFFFLSREKRVAVSTRWKFEVRAKNLEKLHHEGGELSRDSGRRRLERARQLTDVSRDVRRMWAERFIAP